MITAKEAKTLSVRRSNPYENLLFEIEDNIKFAANSGRYSVVHFIGTTSRRIKIIKYLKSLGYHCIERLGDVTIDWS